MPSFGSVLSCLALGVRFLDQISKSSTTLDDIKLNKSDVLFLIDQSIQLIISQTSLLEGWKFLLHKFLDHLHYVIQIPILVFPLQKVIFKMKDVVKMILCFKTRGKWNNYKLSKPYEKIFNLKKVDEKRKFKGVGTVQKLSWCWIGRLYLICAKKF